MSIVLLLLRLTVSLGDEEKLATDSYGALSYRRVTGACSKVNGQSEDRGAGSGRS